MDRAYCQNSAAKIFKKEIAESETEMPKIWNHKGCIKKYYIYSKIC
jgi:hypothetical protein